MIETKVSLPALVDLALTVLGAAIYKVVLAFGWFHPTAQQQLALAALGAAIILVVDKVTAYMAPHTSRPDLQPTDSPQPEPVELTADGSVPLGRDERGRWVAPGVTRFSGE